MMVIRFIRIFVQYLFAYDSFVAFWSKREEIRKQFEDAGDEWYKNRFDYAWKNTVLWWRHRDRYGRKCRKFHGDCERCNAKHC